MRKRTVEVRPALTRAGEEIVGELMTAAGMASGRGESYGKSEEEDCAMRPSCTHLARSARSCTVWFVPSALFVRTNTARAAWHVSGRRGRRSVHQTEWSPAPGIHSA